MKVPGRIYPVKEFWEKAEDNYVNQVIRKLKQIIAQDKVKGDSLAFPNSPEEVEKCCADLINNLEKKAISEKYVVLPLYGKQDSQLQENVFKTYKVKRKIIFATNVAETSVTIDGVTVVIDSGRAKERVFDQKRNISIIKVNFICQSSAIQRKVRAGRTGPGICYRLYEESQYHNMDLAPLPEILKSDVGLVILQLLINGVEDVLHYDLIDKPSMESMQDDLARLKSLQFVDGNGNITDKGRIASELYLEPSLARMLIESVENGVYDEILMVTSMMTISHLIFKRTKDEREKFNISRIAHAKN